MSPEARLDFNVIMQTKYVQFVDSIDHRYSFNEIISSQFSASWIRAFT